jgi:hypothetical protein
MCSGTVAATWSDALIFVRALTDEMMAKRSCDQGGVDQVRR